MRVHLAYVQEALLRDYEASYVQMAADALRQAAGRSGFVIEEDPARSDLIVLWESVECKNVDYISVLENDPLIRHFAERVFCINYEDHPEGLLAGLYTSLERPFFNPCLHRLWPFLLFHDPVIHDLTRADVMNSCDPKWLFSFIGAGSHKVRRQILELFSGSPRTWYVQDLQKWRNHNGEDRRQFLGVGLESLFCLCPRGNASYTHRITEVMAMARVPVIIADDWIPFSFEEKIPYFIRVPEKDVAHLPDILSARRGDAEKYRQNARFLWEKYCSLENRLVAGLQGISRLAGSRSPRMSYTAYRDLWHSKSFLENAGWTRKQRLALRLEQHVRRWFPAAKMPGVSSLMRYRTYAGALNPK